MWLAAGPAVHPAGITPIRRTRPFELTPASADPRELPNLADPAFWSYPWLGRPAGITKSGGSTLLVVPLARPTPRELPNPATTSGCRRTCPPKFAGEEGGKKKSPEAHYDMLLAREKVRFDFLKSPSLGPERFYFVFCLFFPGKNEKSARTKCG